MFLRIHEINPTDVRHLHCTDPALAFEIEAVNKSIGFLGESVSKLDTPDIQPQGTEVTAWPVL